MVRRVKHPPLNTYIHRTCEVLAVKKEPGIFS
jgi:hypothetical protein